MQEEVKELEIGNILLKYEYRSDELEIGNILSSMCEVIKEIEEGKYPKNIGMKIWNLEKENILTIYAMGDKSLNCSKA